MSTKVTKQGQTSLPVRLHSLHARTHCNLLLKKTKHLYIS